MENTLLLHILRNPYGWDDNEVRKARLTAADLIEDLERQLEFEKSKKRSRGFAGQPIRKVGAGGTARPPTPTGWSDTDWLKHLQGQHPLSGLHINQGSMDAAADAYEAEYNARHNAEVRGDGPLYGAASLSTDGFGGADNGERK